MLETWRDERVSFRPTRRWLQGYRRRHEQAVRTLRGQNVPTPPTSDDDIPAASWIRIAHWDVYYDSVTSRVNQYGGVTTRHNELDLAALPCSHPVETPILLRHRETPHHRRIPALWLVRPCWRSRQLRRILRNGTVQEHNTIVRVINTVARYPSPLPYDQLAQRLARLTALGLTMRVWSRLLCIVRPDLYCTIASESVRKGLSKAFGIAQNRLAKPEGYVELLTFIHESPWHNSPEPRSRQQAAIWRRRMAFLDAIFYQ